MGAPDESSPSPWLLALGDRPAPVEFQVGGRRYVHDRTFKHDFFALTARYRLAQGEPEGAAEAVVIKIGRRRRITLLPMGWLGRLMTLHESALYRRVADLPIVPEFLGRLGPDVLAHAYQPGTDLYRGRHVPAEFFELLREGIEAMHAREVVYMDLEKPENVLVGDDGRPYLFDFQVSYHWPARWGGRLAPMRWLRRRLEESDFYHVTKLKRLCRGDLMSKAERKASRRNRPIVTRAHRKVIEPFQRVRRRILGRLEPRAERTEAGRVGSANEEERVRG